MTADGSISSLVPHGRVIGLERSLQLTTFRLREDLDEGGDDDARPEGPAEGVEEVGHQEQRLRRDHGSEEVATDMGRQPQQEPDRQAPVEEPLLRDPRPQLGQVLADQGELLVGEGLRVIVRSWSSDHGLVPVSDPRPSSTGSAVVPTHRPQIADDGKPD